MKAGRGSDFCWDRAAFGEAQNAAVRGPTASRARAGDAGEAQVWAGGVGSGESAAVAPRGHVLPGQANFGWGHRAAGEDCVDVSGLDDSVGDAERVQFGHESRFHEG